MPSKADDTQWFLPGNFQQRLNIFRFIVDDERFQEDVEEGMDKSYYFGSDWQHPREFKSEYEMDVDYGFCCNPEHESWFEYDDELPMDYDELPMKTPENVKNTTIQITKNTAGRWQLPGKTRKR
jgi:hypothetical protein